MMFKQQLPQQCPNCFHMLHPISMLISDWPYIHTDIIIKCRTCHASYLFGIPLDKLSGSNLQIYDSTPAKVLAEAKTVTPGVCPFHKAVMRMTKIFGDKLQGDGDHGVRVQFKCPRCYYLIHVTLPKEKS